ncbi:hypothetical protein LCGC14_0275500 [marine sediment metagenome]|uniref:HTH arsR-type domain-containing protein n=1 Tax=marine sediment metagenome TaxID=412755 RepID=A0A0F9TXI0_9ZZZZ
MTSTVPIALRQAILEYLGRVTVDVSAEAVALAVGRSRSVAQRHLGALCREGVVEWNTGFNLHSRGNTKMYYLVREDDG